MQIQFTDCFYGAENVIADAVMSQAMPLGEERALCVPVLDSETGMDTAIFQTAEFKTLYTIMAKSREEHVEISLIGVEQDLVERAQAGTA